MGSYSFPILIFLCGLLSPTTAQEQFVTNGLVTEVFKGADGIGFGAIQKVIQDEQGMIWGASGIKGLFRYDGYSFKNFVPEADRFASIKKAERTFTTLFEDSKNRIWFGNASGGVGYFDPAYEQFTFFPLHPDSTGFITAGQVLTIAEDDYGDLWLGTNQGLIRVIMGADAPSREEVMLTTHFYAPKRADPTNRDSILGQYITSLYKDANGVLWAGSPRGLTKVERSGSEYFRFTHYTRDTRRPDGMHSRGIYQIAGGKNGSLWLAGAVPLKPAGGQFIVEQFDPVTGTFYAFPSFIPGNISVKTLLEDRAGVLWVGTNDGLYQVEPPFRVFAGSSPRLKDKVKKHDFQLIGGKRIIFSLMEDHSGMVWIAAGGTLHKVNPGINRFNYVDVSAWTGKSHAKFCVAIEDGLGRTWMTDISYGLYRFDFDWKSLQQYQHDPADPGSLTSNSSWGLFQDSQNRLWVGTNRGLCLYRPNSDSFIRYNHLPDSPDHYYIMSFWEAPDGILWIGTLGQGLFLFDPQTETFTSYRHDPKDPTSILSNSVGRIFQDRDGAILVVTMAGLNKVIMENEGDLAFQRISPKGINLMWAHEDRKGRLWLTGWEHELLLLDRETGNCRTFGKAEGFPGYPFNCIIEDDHGNLWLIGGAGILKFNPEDETVFFYGQDYHIPFFEGGRYATENSKGEIITYADGKGIFIFHPDSIRPNLIPPRVQLTGFRLFNELVRPGEGAVLQRAISETDQIRLTHHQNNIAIEYVGLHYDQPSGNRYRIKMDNLDEDWVDVGSERIARYPDLRPGKYTFRVKAANRDGVWSETPASIQVIIAFPWWRQWWAYGLFLAVFLAVLYSVYHYQVTRQLALQETKRLQEIDALKTRLYTNISHEFRTPLTVILGMAEQVVRTPERWSQEGLKMIIRNGQNLLNLVNQMLDLRKIESGVMKVDKQQGDVITYLKYIVESFHSFAASKHIDLNFSSPLDELIMDYDEDKLLRIVTNLLSNALKYTPAGGEVTLSADRKMDGAVPETLVICVQDTGAGIAPEQRDRIFDRFYQVDDSTTRKGEGIGVGLALTQELVRLLKGTITVESELGKGSIFTVRLPVTREAAGFHILHQDVVLKEAGALKTADLIEEKEKDFLPAGQAEEDGKPLALIIDDNQDVVRYLTACLEQEYQLLAAYDGRTGIETAIEHIPDVIICDVMMPEKDGFEVTATLKKDERTSHIPIILLTARATVEDRIAGLERGADAYLAKPFHREELMVRMQKMVELRAKLQERYAGLPPHPATPDPVLATEDEFVQKVRAAVEARLDDPDLTSAELATTIFLSRSQLHRKLKALTGRSSGQLIRDIRLQHAHHLLSTTGMSVTQIAFEVGYRDLSHFSRSFSEVYGVPPSEIKK